MERTSDDRHRAHARTVQTQLCHDNRNRMYALDEMAHARPCSDSNLNGWRGTNGCRSRHARATVAPTRISGGPWLPPRAAPTANPGRPNP